MKKVNAFIVNRNLLTTLKNTIDFLKKEKRIEIWVIDQNSSYPELLSYYDTKPCNIIFNKSNDGPYSCWHHKYNEIKGNQRFIITDSDCIYDNVPDDWFDKMSEVLNITDKPKVGFSLEINDLPNTVIGSDAKRHESKYWINRLEYGWDSHIDTTFALYKPHSGFSYEAIRLDRPYCIKHQPWYLTKENITDEWKYYLKTASSISTWGSKLKNIL